LRSRFAGGCLHELASLADYRRNVKARSKGPSHQMPVEALSVTYCLSPSICYFPSIQLHNSRGSFARNLSGTATARSLAAFAHQTDSDQDRGRVPLMYLLHWGAIISNLPVLCFHHARLRLQGQSLLNRHLSPSSLLSPPGDSQSKGPSIRTYYVVCSRFEIAGGLSRIAQPNLLGYRLG
jgi:hypothetical protein